MTPTGLWGRRRQREPFSRAVNFYYVADSPCTRFSPYVCCRGDGSLVHDLRCDIFRRAVIAVVLFRWIQFDRVAEVADADLVARGTCHQNVFRLEGGGRSKGLALDSDKLQQIILKWRRAQNRPLRRGGRCFSGEGTTDLPKPAECSSGSEEKQEGTLALRKGGAVRATQTR